MTRELRRLHSPDVVDLRNPNLPDDTYFSILVSAMIGPRGEPGEESYDFIVCSGTWTAVHAGAMRYFFGRGYLILERYSYDLMWNAISTLCRRISGTTWSEIAERLSRYGTWEFEDYQDYRPR